MDTNGASQEEKPQLAAKLRDGVPPDELLGTTIAGYQIESLLGSGAQAWVFRARQLSLGRSVALKVLLPSVASGTGLVERFLHEARCLAAISHQNVVHVYEVGSEDDVHFIAMEEVRGRSLKETLDTQGRIPPEMAVNLVKQCVCGLERVARAGLVHRDIKPANLMVDDTGTVVITDFGLAIRAETGGSLAGTMLYMSPEQAEGEAVETASDQYALGATLYHLLTGRPPFVAANRVELRRMHRELPSPDPCLELPDLPPELGQIVTRMMAKAPDARYADWRELFRALEDFELRNGYIEGRSAFLAEGLIDLGRRSVSRVLSKIIWGVVFGVGITAVAAYAGELLKAQGAREILGLLGIAGASLLVLAFLLVMYIACVRKGWLPQLGSLRAWLQVHILVAITGYALAMVHSANFFQFFRGAEWRSLPGGGRAPDIVSLLPFLNALLFTMVVSSGFVGRFLWRDLATQVLAERIEQGTDDARRESNELSLAIFAHRSLRYWRVVHYPLAFALLALTLLHTLSLMYFGG